MIANFEELTIKYLDGSLSEDEKESFAKMLSLPENEFYLASKIDEQFSDKSLKQVGADEIGKIIYQEIKVKINGTPIGLVYPDQHQQPANIHTTKWYNQKWTRVAASVAAVLILFFGLQKLIPSNEKLDEQAVAINGKKVPADSTISVTYRETNTTGKERSLQLPDGSLVKLANNSEIGYQLPFIKERNINLKGKAFFKVAKDKTKPFTVTGGNISTTAVGTQFTVTSFPKANQIKVRLFEGKVMVKILRIDKKPKQTIYLAPGEQFVYNPDGSFKITRFNVDTGKANDLLNEGASSDRPLIPENTNGTWYMFNNQSLGGVLDQLAAMYNVKIIYDKKDVQKISFTGRYNKTDSLEKILKELAILHGLKITKEEGAYMIKK